MTDDGERPSAAAAGVVAGIACLAVFLVLHHVWIAPIWFIAPVGAVVAGAGGAAVGVSYAELRSALPERPWRSGALAAIWAVVLLPAMLIAQVRGPVYAIGKDGAGTLLVPPSEAMVDVAIGLIAVAMAGGALIGWCIGRSRRAAVTTMAAAACVAIGPGHNIPLLGGSPAVSTELALLVAMLGVGSIVLVEADARLGPTRATPTAGLRT
jgi:hypothetical protein